MKNTTIAWILTVSFVIIGTIKGYQGEEIISNIGVIISVIMLSTTLILYQIKGEEVLKKE